MKFFKSLTNLVLYFLLCVFIGSCIDKDDLVEPKPDPEPTPVEKEYELADNVIELEGDLLKHVTSLKGDTLVYNSNTPDDALPEVGEIVIVTQPTDVFPYGFLGKVTKISNDGNFYVITEPAALDEAFVYLDVKGIYELESTDVEGEKRASKEFPFEDKFEVQIGDFVKTELELKTKVVLDIDLQVDKRNGKKVRSGHIEINQENHAAFDIGFTFKFLEQEGEEIKKLGSGFKVARIIAGPIIIVPTLQPYLKSEYKGAMDFKWGFETWSEQISSLNFDGKGWSLNTSKDERGWSYNAGPEMEMSGSAFLGGGLALEFRFYGNENIKAALNGQFGVEASGEVSVNLDDLKNDDEEMFYNQLDDSKVSLALKGGIGLEAGAKIFFIEAKWEHPLYEKTFFESSSYIFPSFKNVSLAYANGGFSASTNLGRNLLWKQNVGLALYKGDERIEVSEPVEYKFENDFKERNPLEGIFEDIPEEEKGDYSIWSYVKWGDFYIKCKQLIPKKKIKRMSMTEVSTSSMCDVYSFYYTNDSIDRIVHKEGYYDDGITYRFNYLNDSTIKVIGTISDEKVVCNLKLNDDGYIKKCLHSYSGSEGSYSQTFEFEYDDDGRMTYMKRSEGNEVWRLVYNNSNAISVSCNGNKTNSISYGNLECPENWIWYEWMMGLDIDEMDIFGLIGMLGKSSKNLPTVNKGLGEEYSLHYDWSMDGYGYPDRVVIDEDGSDYVLNLSWE